MDIIDQVIAKNYARDTMAGAGAIKGDKGDKGDTGEISVGTVTSGTTPTVTNSGTKTNAVFDFVLPKGDKGDTATISVGSVTSGTTPSVTNIGTNTDAILDFVLEKGDKGDTGEDGLTAHIFVGTVITGDIDVIVDIPTSNVGDIYINSNSSNVYQRTDNLGTTNLWQVVGNIKGDEGDNAYEVAVSEGFVGTKSEWLESLHGEAKESLIVWEKPNVNNEDTQLHTWYYYKIDGDTYGSGSAWLNRFNVPTTQDYPDGDYAFFNGINYLCFSCNTPIPALTQKDTTQFYVLYNEQTNQCQARMIDIASGTETSLNWTNVTVSTTVPDGYMEVQPDGGVIQYGKWVQTIYLGSSKSSAYDCTISTGTDVSGFITNEAFSNTIGSLGLLTTTDNTNLVGAINEVNGKFSNYIPKTDVVDSLTSTDTTKPLSANQGKELEDKKVNKDSIVTTLDSTVTDEQVPSALATYNNVRKIIVGETINESSTLPQDIRYFPLGKYTFRTNAIAQLYTELPVNSSGELEIFSPNPDVDLTSTYCYRVYRFTDLNGTIYTRSLNTGATAGVISYDAGWEKVNTNITTTLNSSCTDEQVPSAKAVYDKIKIISIEMTQSEISSLDELLGEKDSITVYRLCGCREDSAIIKDSYPFNFLKVMNCYLICYRYGEDVIQQIEGHSASSGFVTLRRSLRTNENNEITEYWTQWCGLATDGNGIYGYIRDGKDYVIPFEGSIEDVDCTTTEYTNLDDMLGVKDGSKQYRIRNPFNSTSKFLGLFPFSCLKTCNDFTLKVTYDPNKMVQELTGEKDDCGFIRLTRSFWMNSDGTIKEVWSNWSGTAIDKNGNYGYLKAGDTTVTPFSN